MPKREQEVSLPDAYNRTLTRDVLSQDRQLLALAGERVTFPLYQQLAFAEVRTVFVR